ncbi:hypothetical protein Y1Q_0021782 [Alligator mississippiensis]|uniref:Uncharacterized protein n=1 Tax=Alligator mississippiensis TaxID=8496 RepID=A0A151PAX2_ALLMI|nr:hypothetical protein Y1Q_0021782 [Alligator mississippiensis]
MVLFTPAYARLGNSGGACGSWTRNSCSRSGQLESVLVPQLFQNGLWMRAWDSSSCLPRRWHLCHITPERI